MLDKCASRQRVNRAGKYSSKKRILILCTEKLAPSSFWKSRHPSFPRRQKFRRGFFRLDRQRIASATMFLQECLQNQAEQKVRDTH